MSGFLLIRGWGDAYSNDMEVATMLSNLRVQAPKQLPRDHLVKDRWKSRFGLGIVTM